MTKRIATFACGHRAEVIDPIHDMPSMMACAACVAAWKAEPVPETLEIRETSTGRRHVFRIPRRRR